jgi:hypothetical protein
MTQANGTPAATTCLIIACRSCGFVRDTRPRDEV